MIVHQGSPSSTAERGGRGVDSILGADPANDAHWVDGARQTQIQVFRVHMPPDMVIRPHYHPVAQFQLFTAGSGKIGKHALGDLPQIHYADDMTTYGPLSSGPDGLSYWVFRPHGDRGAFFMPESRAVKDKVSRRSLRAGDATVEEADGVYLAQPTLDPKAVMTLPARQSLTFLFAARGGGTVNDEDLGEGQFSVHRPGEDGPLRIEAGDDGLTLSVMSFATDAA